MCLQTLIPTKIYAMKKQAGICALLLVSLCAGESAESKERFLSRPDFQVELESEAVKLAEGFAKAFAKMPAGPKYIKITGKGEGKYLEGSVQELEAFEGVLLVRMERGPVFVIDAERLIWITNRKPEATP